MKSTNYCQKIFGSVETVKRLIVAQIREERMRQNLTTEALDTFVGLSAEYPTFRELEEDPNLFHPEILQTINWTTLEHDGFDFCCSCLDAQILSFLNSSENLDQVMKEWLAKNHQIHLTLWPADETARDEFIVKTIKAIYEGRPTHWPGGINSVTPIQWGTIHIFRCIMEELQ